MMYFNSSVLLVWCLIWVGWFFCLSGTKWFDRALKYRSYEYDSKFIVAIGSALAIVSNAVYWVTKYIDTLPNVEGTGILYFLAFLFNVISTFILLLTYGKFGLVEIHNRIRAEKNY